MQIQSSEDQNQDSIPRFWVEIYSLTNTQDFIQVYDNIESLIDSPRQGWNNLYLIPIHNCYLFRIIDRLLHTTLEGFMGLA